MTERINRNGGLDLLKFICAFFVICEHTFLPGEAGRYIVHCFLSIAVPVFFMISGYCYQNVVDRNRQIKQMVRIVVLFVGTLALYLVINLLFMLDNLEGFFNIFLRPTKESLLQLVLFNVNAIAPPFWYFQAFLYVLFIVWICSKWFDRKYLYYAIPLLLGLGLVLGAYSSFLFENTLPNYYTRNFLLEGLPFFLIGDMIRMKNISFDRRILFPVSIGILILCFVERYLMLKITNVPTDFSLFTSALAICFFLLFTKPFPFLETKVGSLLSNLGKKYSTSIYISHWAFIIFAVQLFDVNRKSDLILWLYPLIVFALTLVTSYLVGLIPTKKK